MRSQALGLAQASVAKVVEMRAPPWRPWAPPFSPPWPNLVISCGRRSVWASRALRRRSGGAALHVHIQDPRLGRGDFDLIFAMAHDRVAAGGNVHILETALHDVTSAGLETARTAWAERFGPLGRPLIGAIVGGDTNRDHYGPFAIERFVSTLADLATATDAGLVITPSRRTSDLFRRALREKFAARPRAFLWDLEGDNPYLGILGLADRLVVTGDSVSMISEAISAGPPVEVFDAGFRHHQGFMNGLQAKGLIRRFTGEIAPPAPHAPINPTAEAAAIVRAELVRKLKMSD
jgi:uncharacterized protein